RLEANVCGHTCLGATTRALGPGLRQEEPEIDQRVFPTRDIAEVDADLAVVDLAESPAPLPLNAYRFRALLGEGRRIENQHAVVFAQLCPDLPRQLCHQRPVA